MRFRSGRPRSTSKDFPPGRPLGSTVPGQASLASRCRRHPRKHVGSAVDPRGSIRFRTGCKGIRAWIEKGIRRMTWIEITNLVERAQAGDRTAYGELIERFQPTVYAVALSRLRNPAEAQELAQEVFLHGMKKLSQLRDPQCFAGWLRQITVRMAINRLTRRGPIQKVEPEVLENAEAGGA